MKSGMFPGQQEALRELARKGLKYEGVARRQRRMFLGFCFGTAAVGAGAFWAGRGVGSPDSRAEPSPSRRKADPRILEQLSVAHALAIGPEESLRGEFTTLMLMHNAIGGDDLTWLGVQRLACSCVRADDELDRKIARRVLDSLDALPPPEVHRPSFKLLVPRMKALL